MRLSIAAGILGSVVVGVSAQPEGLLQARQQMFSDRATCAKYLSADAVWIDRAGRLRNRAAIVVTPITGSKRATTE